jgi:D-amino peptidase
VRVAIVADMEGVAQLTDPHELLAFSRPYWRSGRWKLTADVAAAGRGLLAAGAEDVVVLDAHGSGNSGTNLVVEELPERVHVESWGSKELAERGVAAMLFVGFHARAGVPAFFSHTHVPDLRLRVDGELVGENHTTAWSLGLPLLGIVGNDANGRTLGSLSAVPYLAVQRTRASWVEVEPVYPDQSASDAAIAAFAEAVAGNGGLAVPPPSGALLEASLPASEDAARALVEAGWQQRSTTEFAVQLGAWHESRALLWAAQDAGFERWSAYYRTFDLVSADTLERVHDDPLLVEARAAVDAWSRQTHPEWLSG